MIHPADESFVGFSNINHRRPFAGRLTQNQAMPAAPPKDAIRDALAPVDALRGEQSQLETWVSESIAGLESLNHELTEWQRELARQQAQIDQREAAVTEAESADRDAAQRLAVATERLNRNEEELRALEEENAEQLQTLGDLERQLSAASAELKILRKHAQDLSTTLESERRHAHEEHRQVAGELKEVRRLLERHTDLLDDIAGAVDHQSSRAEVDNASAETSCSGADAEQTELLAARAAELRRRATSRRAGRRTPN